MNWHQTRGVRMFRCPRKTGPVAIDRRGRMMAFKRLVAMGMTVAAIGAVSGTDAHAQSFTQTLLDGYSCADAEYGTNGAYFNGNATYSSRVDYTASCASGNTANASGAVITASQTLRAATAQTVGLISNRVSAVRESLRNSDDAITVTAFDVNSDQTGLSDSELGIASGDAGKGVGVWVQAKYTSVDYDAAAAAFDGFILTGMVGVDKLLASDRVLIGLSAGYELSDFDTTFNTGSVESDGFIVSPYVSFRPNDIFSIDATAGYASLSIDTDRQDSASGTVFSGSTDADRYFGSMVANAEHQHKKFLFGVNAGAMYTIESRDAYTETGGADTQAVRATSTRLGQALLGANVGYDGGKVRPFASVRGEFDFSKSEGIQVASTQTEPEESDFGLRVGLGVNFDIVPGLSGTIAGDTVLLRDDYTEYSGLGRLRFEF